MSRTIIHLDADAFFASVEQASDPYLRGKAIAVGGEKRGIIASASYEARQMGVYTPMPTSRARKLCPKLLVLPGDFEKYERFSHWMFSYAYDFTPHVEISSIDEGYFELSGVRKSPLTIAQSIRKAVRDKLKISVSEGIASNKLVSQVASKLNKPAAFDEVPPGGEKNYLAPLPNHWLPGVGPQMSARLNSAGLARISQIAAMPVELLMLVIGKTALSLREFANGRDDRPLSIVSEPAKSYSQQETLNADTIDEEYVEALLHRQADNLMAKVREDHKSIRTVTVKIRYNDMDECQRSESLLEPTDLESDIYPRLRPLLRRAWERRVSLRMVSLKYSNIYEGVFRIELPLEPASRQHDARRRLAYAVDTLRKTHGSRVIFRGHDFLLNREPEKASAASEPQTLDVPPQLKMEPAVKTHGYPKITAPYPLSLREQAGIGEAQPAAPSTYSLPTPPRFVDPPFGGGLNILPARVKPYLPLHVHSYYSFLDSTLSIRAIQELAIRYELPAIALTDQGGLYGAIDFFQALKAAGIKPILGVEVRVCGKPLRLLVENSKGYQNLCVILSQQNTRSPAMAVSRHVARAARPDLFQEKDFAPISAGLDSLARLDGLTSGLIAVSPEASFASLFPNAFYLEISDPARLPEGADRLPTIAATPAHYASPVDRKRFNIVQSIRTLTLLRQAHPEKKVSGDFHFRSPREMRAVFDPALLDRTLEIAARCSFDLPLGKPQFPAYPPPDGSPPHHFLRRLVYEGLQKRYGARKTEVQGQIDQELSIIRDVGYEEYFLIVWDLLQECRQHGIEWITRGSAADSLVCYCLGISNVCPIRFDLFFRRFLNKERMLMNKLPDIDVDFPHDRKDDVIDLIFAKYGPTNAAAVGGFSTYHARGAVGDVAKVLGVSEHQVRRFTEHFPWAGARGIGEAIRKNQECRDLPLDEDPYRSALEMAEFLDGFPRYAKMHPCGVVLSRQPIHELTPTFTSNKGYATTHYDMDAVELIGLVKMDILAQGGLSVMRDAQNSIVAKGMAVDLDQFTIRKTPPVHGDSL